VALRATIIASKTGRIWGTRSESWNLPGLAERSVGAAYAQGLRRIFFVWREMISRGCSLLIGLVESCVLAGGTFNRPAEALSKKIILRRAGGGPDSMECDRVAGSRFHSKKMVFGGTLLVAARTEGMRSRDEGVFWRRRAAKLVGSNGEFTPRRGGTQSHIGEDHTLKIEGWVERVGGIAFGIVVSRVNSFIRIGFWRRPLFAGALGCSGWQGIWKCARAGLVNCR